MVPTMVGGKKQGKLSAYAAKMRELLRGLVTPEQYDAAHKTARAHAGGKAKADAMQMTEPFFFAEDRAVAFMEPPEWIPLLPKPGQYEHASYGTVNITRERNQNFVNNVNGKVYQDELPIDGEHQLHTSGAFGYITGARLNDDGSGDGHVRWTDRGAGMLKADRFSSFSPMLHDQWTDPLTGQVHSDVVVGGALTTRPFFKPKSLRPLAATENALVMDWHFTAPKEGQAMPEQTNPTAAIATTELLSASGISAQSFAEQLATRDAEIAALKASSDATATQAQTYAEQLQLVTAQVAAMESAAQTKRFTDELLGRSEANGQRWFSVDPEKIAAGTDPHLKTMAGLAKAFGEDSEELRAYIEGQRQLATTMRHSDVFKAHGSSATGDGSPEGKARGLAKQYSEAHAGVTPEQAMVAVLSEHPELYDAYQASKPGRAQIED